MRDNWYWFQIMRKSKIECNKWIRQLYLLCPAQFLGSRKVSSSLCGSLFGQVDVKLQGHGDKTWLHWDPTCQFYPCQSDGTSWKTPWEHPRQHHTALVSGLDLLIKLWRILMASWLSWSHGWAKPTVECSVYLLSRINFSSRIAPKSSFLRRLVQWHIQQNDEPKENNFILNCYTKMNLKWFLKWCLKIFLWQFV